VNILPLAVGDRGIGLRKRQGCLEFFGTNFEYILFFISITYDVY
jgi:hypothetical protein